MATEKENQLTWFTSGLLTELELAGPTIANGQCLGYKIPLILGGKIEASNVEIGNIYVYTSLMGQLHQPVRKLPPGTRIRGFKIKQAMRLERLAPR